MYYKALYFLYYDNNGFKSYSLQSKPVKRNVKTVVSLSSRIVWLNSVFVHKFFFHLATYSSDYDFSLIPKTFIGGNTGGGGGSRPPFDTLKYNIENVDWNLI